MSAIARGLIDKNIIEGGSAECVFCSTRDRVCPSGALEFRTRGFAEMDESYIDLALKATTVNEKCVHCDLCAEFSLNHALN